MKVVVIGGTGLIGSKLIKKLEQLGHEAVAASPSKGINTLTGEGLNAAINGAEVVIDVSNAPSFADKPVLEFFETSTRNIMAAEQSAKVRHHIALSVVGTDQLNDSGYFRAKMVQENLIRSANIPYTIVRATQFFEFLNAIVEGSVEGQIVRLPTASLQPIAAEDVATALLNIALAQPINGIIEIGGPERFSFADIIEQYMKEKNDPRTVVADANARYFGSQLADNTLVPGPNGCLGTTDFKSWAATLKTY